jgi:hypothetical protein
MQTNRTQFLDSRLNPADENFGMRILDQQGNPVAYGWNDIAAQERWETDKCLRLISDEEFARRFPEIVYAQNAIAANRPRELTGAIKTSC